MYSYDIDCALEHFLPEVESRLPTCEEVMADFSHKVEELTGAEPVVTISICDRYVKGVDGVSDRIPGLSIIEEQMESKGRDKKPCAFLNMLMEKNTKHCIFDSNGKQRKNPLMGPIVDALIEYNEWKKDGAPLNRSDWVPRPLDSFHNLYCREALRVGIMASEISVAIGFTGDAFHLVTAYGLAKNALGFEVSQRIRMEQERLHSPCGYGYTPQEVLTETMRWSQANSLPTMRGLADQYNFMGGFVVKKNGYVSGLKSDFYIPYLVLQDGWPISEMLTETDRRHNCHWGYRFIRNGGLQLPAKDVRAYFKENDDENRKSRCFLMPTVGICGIQMEKKVLVWNNDANGFLEVENLEILKIWGVCYLGFNAEDGLMYLGEYISDLRKGRVVREKFEYEWMKNKKLLPHQLSKRSTYKDRSYRDEDIAEEGLREGGPSCNRPDYD